MTKQSKSSKIVEKSNAVEKSNTVAKNSKKKEVMTELDKQLHHYIIIGQLDDRIVYRTTVAWATNKRQATRYSNIEAVKKELEKLSGSQVRHIKVFEVNYTEISLSENTKIEHTNIETDRLKSNQEPENKDRRTGKLYWFENFKPVSVSDPYSGDNFVGYCDYPSDVMHTESAQQLMIEEIKKWNKDGAGISVYYVRVNGPYPDGSYVLDYGSHSRFFRIIRA